MEHHRSSRTRAQPRKVDDFAERPVGGNGICGRATEVALGVRELVAVEAACDLRSQFTWSLRQYKLAEDDETRTKFAKRMARYIAAAPKNGFKVEDVTQGQEYPFAEVQQYLNEPDIDIDAGISEGQAIQAVEEAVDDSEAIRIGDGPGIVYAYGYRCAPDRLKVGLTEVDTKQRIAAQVSTSTPDRPVLYVEIRTRDCRSLERAIHSTLEHRGRKIPGAGSEWFKTTRDEVLAIYKFVTNQS
jgi:hypothetical protein